MSLEHEHVLEEYDLIVIGGGPGGYPCALRAAQLGARVALIEADRLGGTCLHRGCIPTKALLHSAELLDKTGEFETLGISPVLFSSNKETMSPQERSTQGDKLQFVLDQECVYQRKDEIVALQEKGVTQLLERAGVRCFKAHAQLCSDNEVMLLSAGTKESLPAALRARKAIVVATGSEPIRPGLIGIEHALTSDEVLKTPQDMNSVLIIGGGVIALEFAQYYSALGAEVCIVEMCDRLLPRMDADLGKEVAQVFKRKNIKLELGASVNSIAKRGEGSYCVEFTTSKGQPKSFECDAVISAVGRKARTEGLFFDEYSLELTGGALQINGRFETSRPGVYAIGDVTYGSMQLAHSATAQGECLAEMLFATQDNPVRHFDLHSIPSCVYTSPEIASIGLSEELAFSLAEEEGWELCAVKLPILSNARSRIAQSKRGFIKLIADAKSRKLLGAHLMCERASDLVSELGLAIHAGMSVDELSALVRPHPSFSEAITEALNLLREEMNSKRA